MYFGVLLACALLLCAYALLWLSGRRARSMLGALPTYPTLPFIGNAHQFLGNTEWLMKVVMNISRIVEKNGLPFAFWIGPYPCIFISDPEDIRVITNASVEKPHFYRLSKELVGDGLIIAPGPIWKHNIKRLGNIFNLNVVDGYQDNFNALSQNLVQKLKEGEGCYDSLNQKVAMTTLQAICQTTLGIPNDMIYDLITPEYYQMLQGAVKCLMRRAANILYHVDPIYRLTPAHKELMRHKSVLHGVCEKMMALKREERETNSRVKNARYTPFIDILLDMQEEDPSLSDEYIKSEMLTIIAAGYDTVGTTVLFSLLILGSHPRVQEKMFAEVNSILGNTKQLLTKEDRARMTYSEAVIKEVMRLHPPVPVFLRAADRDVQIQSCTIPKGTCCCVSIWGTNRLKSYWGEDADAFRPERWLERDYPENVPFYIPFSYGRRTCMGKRYVMPLVKTVLAYCIQDLAFESNLDKMVLALEITARPSSGCSVKIRRRQSKSAVTRL